MTTDSREYHTLLVAMFVAAHRELTGRDAP
jgi:hypothetical protein